MLCPFNFDNNSEKIYEHTKYTNLLKCVSVIGFYIATKQLSVSVCGNGLSANCFFFCIQLILKDLIPQNGQWSTDCFGYV